MKGLHHVGITVSDLERAIDFYHGVLEYVRPPSPVPAPLPQNALGAQHVAFLVDDIEAKKAELDAGIRAYLAERGR